MKLHLPSSLRRALLACVAAFAAPVFTLSSASLSTTALIALSVQQAKSEITFTPYDCGKQRQRDEVIDDDLIISFGSGNVHKTDAFNLNVNGTFTVKGRVTTQNADSRYESGGAGTLSVNYGTMIMEQGGSLHSIRLFNSRLLIADGKELEVQYLLLSSPGTVSAQSGTATFRISRGFEDSEINTDAGYIVAQGITFDSSIDLVIDVGEGRSQAFYHTSFINGNVTVNSGSMWMLGGQIEGKISGDGTLRAERAFALLHINGGGSIGEFAFSDYMDEGYFAHISADFEAGKLTGGEVDTETQIRLNNNVTLTVHGYELQGNLMLDGVGSDDTAQNIATTTGSALVIETGARNLTTNGNITTAHGVGLTLSGDGSFTASSIELRDGGQLTLRGATALTANTLTAGSVTLGSGLLTVNSALNVTGGIQITLTGSNQIKLGRDFSGGTLRLSFANLSAYAEQLRGNGVSLFDFSEWAQNDKSWDTLSTWLSLSAGSGFLSRGEHLELNNEGKLVVVYVEVEYTDTLVWNGANGATWEAADADEEWLNNEYEVNYGGEGAENNGRYSVEFGADHAGDITLSGDLRVMNMSVAGNYIFKGSGSLAVGGDLRIISGKTTLQDTVSLTVTGTLSMEKGTTLSLGNASGTAQQSSVLTLMHGGAITNLESNGGTIITGDDLSIGTLTQNEQMHFSKYGTGEEAVTVSIGDFSSDNYSHAISFGEKVNMQIDSAVSGYRGLMTVGGNAVFNDLLTINGNGKGETKIKVGGSLTVNGALTVNHTNAELTVGGLLSGDSASISAGRVKANGGLQLGGKLTLSGGLLTVNSSLRVAKGVSISLTGGELMAFGADFSCKSLTLSFNNLSRYASELNAGGVSLIDFSAWTTGDTSWNALSRWLVLEDGGNFLGANQHLEVTEEGKLVLAEGAPQPPSKYSDTLEWTGADATWKAVDDTADWINNDYTVSFGGEGAENDGSYIVIFGAEHAGAISVEGEVRVQNMKVEGAYSFSGSATDSITVGRDLEISSGITTFNGLSVSVGGAVSGSGSANVGVKLMNGATLSLAKGGSLGRLDYSDSAATIKLGGNLTIAALTGNSNTAEIINFNHVKADADITQRNAVTVTINGGDGISCSAINFGKGVKAHFTWAPSSALQNGGTISAVESITFDADLSVGAADSSGHISAAQDLTAKGNLTLANAASSISIGQTLSVSGDVTVNAGSLTVGNQATLAGSLVQSGGSVEFSSLKAKSVELSGGSLALESGSITSLTGAGGSLTVGSDLALTNTTASLAQLTLNGALAVGSGSGANQLTLSKLTLGKDATLEIRELNGDRALFHLSSDFTLQGAGSLAIDLSSWSSLASQISRHESISYALFSGLADYGALAKALTGLEDWIYKAGDYKWMVEFDSADGKLVFNRSTVQYLYWSDDCGNTWSADTRWANENGGASQDGSRYTPGDVVIFGDAPTNKDVTIAGQNTVYDMHVLDNYTFDTGSGSLSVRGELYIAETKSTVFEGAGSVFLASAKGDGTLVVGGSGSKGGVVTLGKGSGFSGNVTLNEGSLTLEKGLDLLGNKPGSGVLTLAGGTLSVAAGNVSAKEIAVEGTVMVSGANAGATLAAGSISGSGFLSNAAGNHNKLSGDISAFSGVIQAASDASWTLTDDLHNTVDALALNLSGEGCVTLAYANAAGGALAITGQLTGGLSFENALAGKAKLVLANGAKPAVYTRSAEPPTANGSLIFNGNVIQLGSAEKAGVWAGSSLKGSGKFVLVNGALEQALTDTERVDVQVNAQGAVYAGGTAAESFRDIAIHGEMGGSLSGVVGDIVAGDAGARVCLSFGEANIGSEVGSGVYLINSSDDLVVKSISENGLTLDFSNDSIKDVLLRHRENDTITALHIIEGGNLVFDTANGLNDAQATGGWALLRGLGFSLAGAEGGDLVIVGTSRNVYLVLNDQDGKPDPKSHPHMVTDSHTLSAYSATVIDAGATLTVTASRSGSSTVVNNLVGLQGSVFHAMRSGSSTVNFVLNNSAIPEDLDQLGLDHLDAPAVIGRDTLFEGTIIGDEGVNFTKDGAGTLTVGDGAGNGGLELEGSLTLANGGLTLQGSGGSHVDSLIISYTDDSAKGGLEVTKHATLAVTDLTDTENRGSEVRLTEGGKLTLNGKGILHDTSVNGDGSGSLVVNGSLALTGKGTLNGVAASVEGTLDLGTSADNSLTSLSGSGVLAGGRGSAVTLSSESAFSGTLDGSMSPDGKKTGGGSLIVAGRLTLAEAKSTKYVWNAFVQKEAGLTVDVQRNTDDLALNVTLNEGASLEYIFSTDNKARLRGDMEVKGEADFSVVINGSFTPNDEVDLGISLTEGELSMLHFSLDGVVGKALEGELKKNADGSLSIGRVRKSSTSLFTRDGMAKNAAAGANMLWEASEYAWEHKGDLQDFWMTASRLSGAKGELDRPLAALAGASTAVLGSAISRDMQRQLGAIRNRAMSMNSDAGNSSEPVYHMWLNGEGSYQKLNSDNLAPGYSLNSWGGTVGFDIAGSKNTIVGLSLSAMYGDLKVQSADDATGDVDTAYVSAFARISHDKWMHTAVVSGGLADVSLERTVSVGNCSYNTTGKTSGYAVGALYELGYAGYVNANGTFAIQPVFNIELSHSTLKGYREDGSDAGLDVGSISHTTLTFGLGARIQTTLSDNMFNGGALLESRALVKADALDRRGKAQNKLLNGSSVYEVESAEVGAIGVEIGAGVSLPTGSGSVFADAALELRSGYNHVNATVGYRVNF